jgi:transposase
MEERKMVEELRERGLTIAEIARELDKSLSWVYGRLNEAYAPKGKERVERKEKPTREEELAFEVEEIERELKELKEERIKIDEEINVPYKRSYEDLLEYRKKRDKDVLVPDIVPGVA